MMKQRMKIVMKIRLDLREGWQRQPIDSDEAFFYLMWR